MIIDKLENAQFYYGFGEKFQKAFEFLQRTDLKNMGNGRYEIDGNDIYVALQDYNTKSESEGKFEAHKEYIDIQFIVTGSEKLGYGDIEHYSPITEYDKEKDIVFLANKEKENHFVFAKENDFVIFAPQDAHMPCISINESTYVKKAVVKIKV